MAEEVGEDFQEKVALRVERQGRTGQWRKGNGPVTLEILQLSPLRSQNWNPVLAAEVPSVRRTPGRA